MAALQVLDREDSIYLLQNWLPQFDAWNRSGTYRTIAESLELQDGEHHIDLGCGFGMLALEARRMYPNAVIWGVDRTRMALMVASKTATDHGIAAEIHANGGMMPDTEGTTLSPIFQIDEKRIAEMHPFEPGGPVQLIMDDIRTMNVVLGILGDRKIDSASFVFPGFGSRAIYENPYSLEETSRTFSSEVAAARVSRYMKTVRKMALFFATEVVREDGQLIVAERAATRHPDDILVPLQKQLKHTGLDSYWAIEGGMSLGSVSSPEGTPAWSVIDEDGTHYQGGTAFGGAVKLRRKPDPNVEELRAYARYQPRPTTARESLLAAARRLFGR